MMRLVTALRSQGRRRSGGSGAMRAKSPSSVGSLLSVVDVGCHPIALAIDEVARHVIVVNRGNLNDGGSEPGSVCVLDAGTGIVLHRTSFGEELVALALDEATGHIFVADRGPIEFSGPRIGEPAGSGSVTTLDSGTGAVVGSVSVGQSPQAMVFDPRNQRVFVANQGDGSVSVLDARVGALIGHVSVGREPLAVVISPERGRVFVE